MLAGLCVALMLTQSVGESALTVVAAEGGVEAAVEEGFLEEDVVAGAAVSNGDVGDPVTDEDDSPVAADVYSARAGRSGDGEDKQVNDRVLIKKDGSIWVTNGETETGEIEVVLIGSIDSDGVVTIRRGIDNIPSSIFSGWEDITELRFESGAIVKAISTQSFSKCKNLKKIDFSNCQSLTQIGTRAFSECESLEEVKFHDNLQFIYSYAFEKCKALKSVTLVPGLIRVQEYAFSGCSSLESVTLETANVVCLTAYGNAAQGIFNNCNIKSINFAIRNVAGDTSKNNIIVPANLFYKATFAEDADIVIPSNIQEIGEGAFGESNLKKITLEDTVSQPSSLTTIGKRAFYKCTLLESITFPITVQSLGESSFEGCLGLTELVIPDSVTTLNAKVFCDCKNVATVKLSNATTTVGDYVFANCLALKEVDLPEGLTFTGKGEFKGCKELRKVTIPSTMEIIGDETFMDCVELTQVRLPDSVTSLGMKAFEGCTGLLNIRYSESLTEIKDRAFYNCFSLSSNVFPETLETIGVSAFFNCESFYNLTIPENVTSIGQTAFQNCHGINILTIKTDKLTKCGVGIFNQCLLREVWFPEGITTIPGNLFNQATFTTDSVMTIPNTVTTIGNGAFGGTKATQVNVSTIQFEEGTKLTTIGAQAFMYCTALESFTIPETTEEIGANAFEGCIKISSIVIPENVTKIGASAFSGCEVLTDITYNAIHVTTSNQNIFAKCNVKRILIGEKVSAFPDNLFRGAQFSTNTATGEEELISIYIPASVEKIGNYALPNIANLQKVVFADGSKLSTIGQYAFYQCINLTSCNLPDSVTSIGNFAFAGCTKLGSDSAEPFSIPASLDTLGSNAFQECPSLTEVVIPSGVNKINDKAFLNDTGLASVKLAGGFLTEIGVSSFEGCTALTEVSIPNGVTKIGATAFKNCSALTKVVIPASVTSIGKDAFDGCGNVQFFVVPGSYAEKWLEDNGLTSSKLLTITYVLDGGNNAPENPAGYEAGDTFLFAPATRKGYAFKGWYLDENFQTEIKGVEGCTGNITIYAKWEIDTYTITYVLDGGENHKDNPTTYTILDKITLKDATKEGFTFKGWYNDPENTKSKVTTIAAGSSGDRTLYAVWDGGTTEAPTASIESGSKVKSGTKLFLTSDTPGARIYYTLDGTIPTEASAPYTGGIVIDRNLIVMAVAVKPNGVYSKVAIFMYTIIDENTFWGDISPADQAQYGSAADVPKGIWVAGVEEAVYTGQKITFNLRVYDHKTLLQEKTDYTVKYANNTNAGDKDAAKKAPTVTITAKGNYKGKVVVKFTICQQDISGEDFSAEDIITNATGKLQKPVPVLYYGKKKLKNKKDYSVEYLGTTLGGYQNKGEYEVKLKGQGNFKGERTVNFILEEGVSVAKAKITGLSACPYTGEAIIPEFTVKVGSDTLVKGTDYEVVGSNNVNAGTATITIRGKGSYCGTKKATFKITPIATLNKVSFTLDKTSVPYTGIAYEIGKGINVTAQYNGKPLVKDVDYTCSYKKNTDAGTATITFTGMGGYSGTTKKTFKIESANISLLAITFLDSAGNIKEDSSYAYEQGGVKPSIRLTLGGRILVAGTDYTLSYKNNTARGTADITVKGKKNYKGTINNKFTIVQQDIKELSATATDVVYQNKAGVVAGSKTTVTDVNGKTLTEGTDYRVSYAYVNDTYLADGTFKKANAAVNIQKDVIPVETLIAVKITGAGGYKGNTQTYIRVCKKSIASAKVTVRAQTYTGSEIQPGMDQMTVKIGRDELYAGDYEIVGYTNNIKKGTAKVTIRGIGNYGGTKTVNFRIVQKPFILTMLEKMF
ncbi:MAG: leucine-rich repeat protein [Acetatifactor sp.]|nr:leucine-rich repeat protein [Acetatifactor sp.]